MSLKAIELIGDVDEQHQLHAQVPMEVPAGQVRLIVFLPGEDDAGSLWAKGVASEGSAELGDPRLISYRPTIKGLDVRRPWPQKVSAGTTILPGILESHLPVRCACKSRSW